MEALKELSALAIARKKERYPNVPEYAIVKPKYSDKTANGLTTCIIDYLRFSGFYCTRINTQGQYSEKLGKWVKGSTTRGTADIHACVNGKHLSIEVKIGRDKQSEYQQETQMKVEAAGGLYFIAKDYQSFYDWFQEQKKGGML